MNKTIKKIIGSVLLFSFVLASITSVPAMASDNYLNVYFPRTTGSLSGYIGQPYTDFRTYFNYAINQGLDNLYTDRGIDYRSYGSSIISYLDNFGFSSILNNWNPNNPSYYPYVFFVRDIHNNDCLVVQFNPTKGDISSTLETYHTYNGHDYRQYRYSPKSYISGNYIKARRYSSYDWYLFACSQPYLPSNYSSIDYFSLIRDEYPITSVYDGCLTNIAFGSYHNLNPQNYSSYGIYYLDTNRNLNPNNGFYFSFVIGLSNNSKSYACTGLSSIYFDLYDFQNDDTGIYYPLFNFGTVYNLNGITTYVDSSQKQILSYSTFNNFAEPLYPSFIYGSQIVPTPIPTTPPATPTPIPSFGLNDQYATPTPFPSITGSITPIPSDIPIGFNGDTTWDNEVISSAFVDSTNTLNTYLTTPFVIGATSILNYFFVNSTWFKFLLICPIVCLVAFIIGRFRRK